MQDPLNSQDKSMSSADTPIAPGEAGVTRRQLIDMSIGCATAVGASTIGVTGLATPLHVADEIKVPRVKLGKTGMSVSRLACGGSWDIDSEVLSLALSFGVNYIDTAEDYRGGESERRIGTFLKSIGASGHSAERKKLWLVTKTYFHTQIDEHLPGSLKRLQQDYVDCIYMHRLRDPKLVAARQTKEQAERLKKSGMTRFFGFSVHDEPVVECLNAAADTDHIDVIMFRYDCHYYPKSDLMAAIEKCHKKGIGLVAMKTGVGGMTLPDRYDPFRKRGLSQYESTLKAVALDPRIHSICSEMTTTDMVQQNSNALSTKASLADLDAIKEHAELVSHLWCRGCDHLCREASGAGSNLAVADSLRFLMYHDHYKKQEWARDLYQRLEPEQRDLDAIAAADWQSAERACPYHVPVGKLMQRVKDRLA